MRERIDDATLFERTLQLLLPSVIRQLLREHQLHPIIPPKVEVINRSPLTLTVTFVERPAVTFASIDQLKIARKEVIVTEEDVEKMVGAVLTQHGGSPPLTEAFVEEHKLGSSAADLRERIKRSLQQARVRQEREERERALFDAIRKATTVELAEELLEEERQQLFSDLQERIRSANLALDQWMSQTKKTQEILERELREEGERRLRLRFGLETLLEQRKLMATDSDVREFLGQMTETLSAAQRMRVQEEYIPGSTAFERLRWQRSIENLTEEMLKE